MALPGGLGSVDMEHLLGSVIGARQEVPLLVDLGAGGRIALPVSVDVGEKGAGLGWGARFRRPGGAAQREEREGEGQKHGDLRQVGGAVTRRG